MYAIKRGIAWIVRHVLEALFFLPIQPNRMLVVSARKGYSKNLQCICEYLREHSRGNAEILWCFLQEGEHGCPAGLRELKRRSPALLYFAATSKLILCDDEIPRFFPKRGGQIFVNTWHGGGAYKKCAGNNPDLVRQGAREQRSRIRNYVRFDLFLSSSERFTDCCIHSDHQYRGAVLNCGMPRNDIFFSPEERERAAQKVRQHYGLCGYVALYAPTYRGVQSSGADFRFPYRAVIETLRRRTDGPVTILRRAHPGYSMEEADTEGVIDATDYPDMQELLCAADVLITDYSSSIWDYALLGRPCLLYVPDLRAYLREWGVWTPVEEWPGVICECEAALVRMLSSFDEADCARRAEEHLRALGSFERGDATRQLGEWILRRMDVARSERS